MGNNILLPVASRGVNVEWTSNLELVEVHDPPKTLPGAVVRRIWTPDSRLAVQDPKSTDLVTFYEYHAAAHHRKTQAFYVVFRETMDALLAQQTDPERYPRWLMEHPAKQAERKFYLGRAFDNPRKLAAKHGRDEMWFQKWLRPIEEDWIVDALIFFLTRHGIGAPEMFSRS